MQPIHYYLDNKLYFTVNILHSLHTIKLFYTSSHTKIIYRFQIFLLLQNILNLIKGSKFEIWDTSKLRYPPTLIWCKPINHIYNQVPCTKQHTFYSYIIYWISPSPRERAPRRLAAGRRGEQVCPTVLRQLLNLITANKITHHLPPDETVNHIRPTVASTLLSRNKYEKDIDTVLDITQLEQRLTSSTLVLIHIANSNYVKV